MSRPIVGEIWEEETGDRVLNILCVHKNTVFWQWIGKSEDQRPSMFGYDFDDIVPHFSHKFSLKRHKNGQLADNGEYNGEDR